MGTYGFDSYVWANLIWYFVHIDLLYAGKLQEESVRQEHKGLE